MKLLKEHAKEKAGLPAEWEVYRWRAMPPTGREVLYNELTGAVAPRLTKGKRAARRIWAAREREEHQLERKPCYKTRIQ